MKGSTDHLAEARAKMGPKLLELSKLARKKKKESRIVSVAIEELPAGTDLPPGVSRLTGPGYPINATGIRKFWKKMKKSNEEFIEWTGLTMKDYAKVNKGWSQRSWEVLAVENFADISRGDFGETKVQILFGDFD